MSMLIQIFMAVGALTCTTAVAKYVWQARDSFKVVFHDLMDEWYGRR